MGFRKKVRASFLVLALGGLLGTGAIAQPAAAARAGRLHGEMRTDRRDFGMRHGINRRIRRDRAQWRRANREFGRNSVKSRRIRRRLHRNLRERYALGRSAHPGRRAARRGPRTV